MLPTDQVGDEEILYRNVRWKYCDTSTPGVIRLSPEAFFDPQRRPSVDRGVLCNHDPSHTQLGNDGVAVLIACQVRKIDDVLLLAPVRTFRVDVEPKPLHSNPAHAQVFLDPSSNNDKVFRRLRTSLARIANSHPWAIEPIPE